MLRITADNFDREVAEAPGPLALAFWTERDPTCAPLLEGLRQYADTVPALKLCALHIDEQRELAMRFELMRLPTVYLIRGGCILRELSGPVAEPDLRTALDALLAAGAPPSQMP